MYVSTSYIYGTDIPATHDAQLLHVHIVPGLELELEYRVTAAVDRPREWAMFEYTPFAVNQH